MVQAYDTRCFSLLMPSPLAHLSFLLGCVKMNCELFVVLVTLIRFSLAEECVDQSMFCRHLRMNCEYLPITKSLCKKTCGVCSDQCIKHDYSTRVTCGNAFTTRKECNAKGCCWDEHSGIGSGCFTIVDGDERGEK